MLSNKEIIEIINKIETQNIVNEIVRNDVYLWPLLRLSLANSLRETNNKKSLPGIVLFFRVLRDVLNNLKLAARPANGKKKILICGPAHHKNQIYDEKYYSKHQDGLVEFLKEKYDIDCWELDSQDIAEKRHLECKRLSAIYIYCKIKAVLAFLFMNRGNEYNQIKAQIKEIALYIPDIKLRNSFLKLNHALLIETFFNLTDYYAKIIEKQNYNAVIIIAFYHLTAMSIIHACKKIGVKTIEFQHGAQNNYHTMYTHWENIPRGGYQLLPDYFWVWGEASKRRIDKWSKNTACHNAFVGGSIWHGYASNVFIHEKSEWTHYLNEIDKYEKRILLSLQAWPVYFNKKILRVIEESPKEWAWLVRPHPLHPINFNDAERCFSKNNYNCSIDYVMPKTIPLELLFPHIDVHLTGFSTVAFEAALYDVPTIFFHENALDGYDDLIDNKIFYYSKDDKDIFNLICNMRVNRAGDIKYIDRINKDLICKILS